MKKKSIKINVVLNVIKNLCGALFPLITIPYITRVIQPTNYGKYNFGCSIISYITLLASFGTANYAIREGAVIRTNYNKLTKFSREVFTINVFSTIFAYLVLVFLIVFSSKLKDYKLLLAVQSLSIMLITLGADWINSIFEDYVYITIRYIVFQILSIIFMFIFVKTPQDYIKYAAIHVFASSGGNILNIFYLRKYVTLRLTKNCNIRTHIKPMLFLFFNDVASIIYVNSDTTILGLLKLESDVGIYALSVKVYTIVKTILNAMIVVFLPRLSYVLGQNDIVEYKKMAEKIINATCTLLFPAITGVFILSKEILLCIGGEKYVMGSFSLRILSIALLFAVFVAFYNICILIPYREEKICLFSSSISAIVNIILNLILIPSLNYNGAALTTLLSEMIVYSIYNLKCKKYFDIKCVIKLTFPILSGCIGIVFICLTLRYLYLSEIEYIVASIVVSGIVYLVIQILLKNQIINQIILMNRKNDYR